MWIRSDEGPKFLGNDLGCLEFETWPDFVTVAKEAIGFASDKTVIWLYAPRNASNEWGIRSLLDNVLDIASQISGCQGNPRSFILKPEGNFGLGDPDFIWVPDNEKCGTICVVVKGP